MKNVLFVLLMYAPIAAQAAQESLSGTYLLQSSDCIRMPADALNKSVIAIEAKVSKVLISTQIRTNLSSTGLGKLPLQDLSVGEHSGVLMGGSTYLISGSYSENMKSFEYKEFDNIAPGRPLRELRGIQVEINNGSLLITKTGDGLSPRVCKGTKL
jgi:hypothetical protein